MSAADGTRPCPFCGAGMNNDATLCAACGRFSSAAAPLTARGPVEVPLDRLNLAVARWEQASPVADLLRRGIDLPPLASTQSVRKAVGIAAIVIGILLLALWLGPKTNFTAARFGIAAVVAGLSLLFFDRILKPATDMERAGAAPTRLPAVRLLGRDTNIVAVQLLATAYLGERAWWLDVDQARAAAVAVIAAAIVLHPSRARLGPILLAAAAAAYLVVITLMLTSFSFRFNADLERITEPDLVVPLWPIFWIVSAVAVFPQLQLIRWGRFRAGAIRGDILVNPSGNPVLLAFGSAIVIAATAATIYALSDAWRWISALIHW